MLYRRFRQNEVSVAVPDWGGVAVPNRSARVATRTKLAKTTSHRDDAPDHLPVSDIRQAPELFQPRFDSIAYAPGRSEAHVAELRQALGRGEKLDPVTVVAFGSEWFLVDGHHRIAAYRATERGDAVPVRVEHRDIDGEARVTWAVELSCAENKKAKLAMSREDKLDAAWRASVVDPSLSKAQVASRYGVGSATVGNMRAALRELQQANVRQEELERMGWRHANSAARGLKGLKLGTDWDDKQARLLARKLQPVMATKPSPAQLAAALEAYSPGIVELMQMAQAEAERWLAAEEPDLGI